MKNCKSILLSISIVLFLSNIKAQDSLCIARLKICFANIPIDKSQNEILAYANDSLKFILITDSNNYKRFKLSDNILNKKIYDSAFLTTSVLEYQKNKTTKEFLGFRYGITYYFTFTDTVSQKNIDEWYEYYFKTFSYCVPYYSETLYKKFNLVASSFYVNAKDVYSVIHISKSLTNNNQHFIHIGFSNSTTYKYRKPYKFKKKEEKHHHETINPDDYEILRYSKPIIIDIPRQNY